MRKLTENEDRRVKFTLRLSPHLRNMLAALAEQQNVSLNTWIIDQLTNANTQINGEVSC